MTPAPHRRVPVLVEVLLMRLRILGSAAGGGFPQWNCRCPTCRAVRDGSRPCLPRTQSSIAISGHDDRWFLVNASPDIRAQLEATPELQPRDGRVTPLQAVLLTDAELDHTLGLLLLREGGGLTVHATAATHRTLCDGTSILRTLQRYCPVDWRPVQPGSEVALGDGLTYRAFDVPTSKRARFDVADDVGRVVGYRFTEQDSGRFLVYLPGVQEFTTALRAEVDGAEVLLLDGTCWQDDELSALGLADKTARDMGHLAVADPGGSLEELGSLRVGRAIYVHINNTNPMLIEDSPQRRLVEQRGVEVATDGMEVRL